MTRRSLMERRRRSQTRKSLTRRRRRMTRSLRRRRTTKRRKHRQGDLRRTHQRPRRMSLQQLEQHALQAVKASLEYTLNIYISKLVFNQKKYLHRILLDVKINRHVMIHVTFPLQFIRRRRCRGRVTTTNTQFLL